MVAGLLAEGNGLLKAITDVGLLGGIARSVDWVVGHGTSIPGSVDRRWCSDSDSRSGTLLTREQRVGKGSRSA